MAQGRTYSENNDQQNQKACVPFWLYCTWNKRNIYTFIFQVYVRTAG